MGDIVVALSVVGFAVALDAVEVVSWISASFGDSDLTSED